jgi:hypothetical protein
MIHRFIRPLSCLALAPSAFGLDFVREVRPIFEKHCYECHGAEKQKNDYRLDIKAVALKNIVARKKTRRCRRSRSSAPPNSKR